MRKLLVALALLASLVVAQAQDIGFSPPIQAVPPIVQPLRPVASRALVGQGFVTGLSGTAVQGQSRERMYLADAPISEIRVCYGNWAGAGEVAGPGNLVIEASLESDGPLGVAVFTWSGASNITIAAGATACSDPIFPSAFGLTVFPANATEWFRTGVTAISNTGFPFGNLLGTLGTQTGDGEGAWVGPAFTSQVNATGPMTVPAGGSTASGMTTPFAVIGRFTTPSMPGLCAIGDSINAGVNDTAMTIAQGYFGGNGYVGRAAYGAAGTQIYPTLKLGIGGDSASSGYTQRATFFKYCTNGEIAWGVNDINGGATPATVLTNIETAAASMHAAGIGKIAVATVTPFDTSTDGWITEANQTYVSANFAPGGNKDILNTNIKAAVGTHFIDAVVDAGAAMGGVDPDKWSVALVGCVSPTVAATSDGLHPLGCGHAIIAPLLTTFLQSGGPQLPTADVSWVPTGADWSMDFMKGRYYGINCVAAGICSPDNSLHLGIVRTSAAYGVTANNSTGALIQFGPNTARVTPGRGLLAEKTATNLAASPFAPATQTITVSNATQYTASITGTGSITLSGACAGLVTAGSPVTCTTSTTSLVATISGTPTSMQVETGAIATSPISGTRSAEDIGLGIPPVWLTSTAGTLVVTYEGTPPQTGAIFAAFGTNYLNQNTTTQINTNRTATITATLGAGANNHTVDGLAWDGVGRGLDGNGGTIATDANPLTIVSQAYLSGQGSGGGDTTNTNYVQQITHYPGRLTGATVPTFQQATTP